MTCKDWPLLEEKNIPYYVQIYDIIYQRIREGALREGETLPGENLLAAHWDVSRSTVRMAVRKLEEDGFIYKMQGKRTTVSASAGQLDHSLQRLANPCICNCVAPITRIQVEGDLQQSGGYVGRQLGYENAAFVMGIINASYFSKEIQTAHSVCIFHSNMLEQWQLSLKDPAAMEAMMVRELYQKARRSRITFNTMLVEDERSEVEDSRMNIVLEEVLCGENGEPLAYCKYWLNGSWYRFFVDRK